MNTNSHCFISELLEIHRFGNKHECKNGSRIVFLVMIYLQKVNFTVINSTLNSFSDFKKTSAKFQKKLGFIKSQKRLN